MTFTEKQAAGESDIPVAMGVPVAEGPTTATATPSYATPFAQSSTTATPSTVEVIAPQNLPGGYQFHVDAGGNKSLQVCVPPGGVRAGERFNATIIQENNGGGHSIPFGRWRDGLCDCCRFGFCHAQCCLTFWCSACALGQVLTRMNLNWFASPKINAAGCSAFAILFAITVIYYVVTLVTGTIINIADTEAEGENNSSGTARVNSEDEAWLMGLAYFRMVFGICFGLLIFIITMRARSYIRRKYSIREESCGACEDCCCSFWCTPCTICQMARHTADYANYPAGCCTENGLAPGTPEVV